MNLLSLAPNTAVILMKKMLPEYIVNCFIASGYDEETVICNLDVSDKPGNGISKVESYANRKFADSPWHLFFCKHSSCKIEDDNS